MKFRVRGKIRNDAGSLSLVVDSAAEALKKVKEFKSEGMHAISVSSLAGNEIAEADLENLAREEGDADRMQALRWKFGGLPRRRTARSQNNRRPKRLH